MNRSLLVAIVWTMPLLAAGCSRPVHERAMSVTPRLAEGRYPVVSEAGDYFARYLYALNEPSFEAQPSEGLRVRLMVLAAEPKWSLLRIEETANGATVYYRVDGEPPTSYTVAPAELAALKDSISAVDAWNAKWRSPLVLDGWDLGLEISEHGRHRALWLSNPEFDPANEGFMRLFNAIACFGALVTEAPQTGE